MPLQYFTKITQLFSIFIVSVILIEYARQINHSEENKTGLNNKQSISSVFNNEMTLNLTSITFIEYFGPITGHSSRLLSYLDIVCQYSISI